MRDLHIGSQQPNIWGGLTRLEHRVRIALVAKPRAGPRHTELHVDEIVHPRVRGLVKAMTLRACDLGYRSTTSMFGTDRV